MCHFFRALIIYPTFWISPATQSDCQNIGFVQNNKEKIKISDLAVLSKSIAHTNFHIGPLIIRERTRQGEGVLKIN